jgi:hypothetical protein
MIEQAVELILRITVQRKEGRQDQAIFSVLHGVEQLFGLDAVALGSLGADQLFDQLTRGESPDTARDKCLIFASLVHQAGLAYEEKKLPDMAQPAFHLALVFTLRPLTSYSRANLPEFTLGVDDLLSRLEGFTLPRETVDLLNAYRHPA